MFPLEHKTVCLIRRLPSQKPSRILCKETYHSVAVPQRALRIGALQDNIVFIVTITPTTSGTVTLDVAADAATDAAGNQNTAATAQTVTVDVDRPSVTITIPSGVQNSVFEVIVTFSEPVYGFEQSELFVSRNNNETNSTISDWRVSEDRTIYTAEITSTASGEVRIRIDPSVATDAANNGNTAAASQSVTVVVNAPTVVIDVPSGTQNGVFNATITFSESVSDFVQGDVSLSGTADASITAWNTTDDTVYTATITPTTSGTVILDIAADVATDAASNGNTAAAQQTVTVDIDKPSVTITVPSGTQDSAFDATITFSESVSDFVQGDVSLSGTATASITNWSANADEKVYTATITHTTSGTVILDVAADVATDAANNPNTAAAQQTVTVDIDKPSVTITVPSETQDSAFDATITFTETVSNFVQSDVSLSGTATASITGWTANADDTVYTATITHTTNGTVILDVAADVATDAASNGNTAATTESVTVEVIPDPSAWMPDANLRSAVRSALGLAANENFSKADLATLTSLSATKSQIADLTGLEYATGLTTLVALQNDITSLEPIQDLTTLTEIRIGNNDISDLQPLAGLTALTKLALQRNNITDVEPLKTLVNLEWLRLAGNSITDFSPLVTLVNVTDSDVDLPEPDTTAPEVSISVPSGTQNGAFDATITFTETVSDFVQGDLSLGGTASASITAWDTTDNTIFTATITPTTSGTVMLDIAADVATDAANNGNTSATTQTVTVDVGSPSVSITPDLPESNFSPSNRGYEDNIYVNGPFDIDIEFTEPVFGFEESDFRISRGEATITDFKTVDAQNYTATVSPDVLPQYDYFDLGFTIPAGAATDAAGNPNSRAYSDQIFPDFERHSTTIPVPNTDVNTTTFNVYIRFNSTPNNHGDDNGYKALGFEQADLTLTNNTAGATITDWSEPTTYNGRTVFPGELIQAEITVTQSGYVTFSVAEGVATDRAGNLNTASTLNTVTVRLPGSDLPEAPNVDTTAPSVSITPDLPESNFSPSNRGYEDNIYVNGPFDIDIEFTEPVFGFEESDFRISGGEATITDFKTVDAQNYTATVSPDVLPQYDYFDLGFTIPAGAATDAAGNPNSRAYSDQIFPDFERHSTTIPVPNTDVDTTTFNVYIRFNSTPNNHGDDNGYKALGFEQADLTLHQQHGRSNNHGLERTDSN